MASFSPGFKSTMIAGADLSTHQHKFVKASGATAVLCGSGERGIGVLQNDPADTQAGEIMHDGISKVVFGATVAAGVEIMSDGSGRAIAATATNRALGETRSGADINEVGSVLLYGAPVQLNA